MNADPKTRGFEIICREGKVIAFMKGITAYRRFWAGYPYVGAGDVDVI